MGLFATRNNDGASGLAEPTSTVTLKEYAKLKRDADRHGCDTVAELITAPSSKHRGEFSPRKAATN